MRRTMGKNKSRTCEESGVFVSRLAVVGDAFLLVGAMAGLEEVGTEVATFEAETAQPERRQLLVEGLGEAWKQRMRIHSHRPR